MSEEIKISQLQEANEISANDFMMIIQSGVNKKKNIKQMAKELNPVVVSPTQPTTNEKVWFKKGKNLLNKNNYVKDEFGYVGFVVNLEYGQTYTLSSNLPIIAKFAKGSNLSDETVGPQNWIKFTSWTFVAGQNTGNYLNNVVYIGINEKEFQKNVEAYSNYNIQIEPGSKASAYESYIEPTMFVKNEGIFENFGAELLSNQFKLVDRNNSTNYNDFKASGFYQCNFQNGTNAPSAYATGMLLVFASYYIVQLLISQINNEMHVYTRISTDKGSTWLAWKEL